MLWTQGTKILYFSSSTPTVFVFFFFLTILLTQNKTYCLFSPSFSGLLFHVRDHGTGLELMCISKQRLAKSLFDRILGDNFYCCSAVNMHFSQNGAPVSKCLVG